MWKGNFDTENRTVDLINAEIMRVGASAKDRELGQFLLEMLRTGQPCGDDEMRAKFPELHRSNEFVKIYQQVIQVIAKEPISMTWGRVFALLDHCIAGGITARDLNLAALTPPEYFNEHRKRAMPMPEHAAQRMKELRSRLKRKDLKDKTIYSNARQGQFYLGYHKELEALAERLSGSAGRPPKGSAKAVDWSSVDWSHDNVVLARSLGVTRQVVAVRRKRHDK